MKLLYLEARKGILRRATFLSLALFLCLNILKIGMDYRSGGIREIMGNTAEMENAFSEIYSHSRGPITLETAGFVVSEYQRLSALVADGTYSREYQKGTYSGYIFGDYYLFGAYFHKQMSYCVQYHTQMEDVLKQETEALAHYQSVGNQRDAARSAYILKHYADRNIPTYYLTDGWEALISYDFSDLLILLLLILGVAPSFTREKETGMTMILYSSKRGKWPMLLAKCAAVVFYACLLGTLFSIVNALAICGLCGFEGGSSPLYAIASYLNTPYFGSIISFYIICSIVKIVGFSIISILLVLLSACCQRTLYPCLIGVGMIVALEYLSGWAVSCVWWKAALAAISPLTLTKVPEFMNGLYGSSVGSIFLLRIYLVLFVQIVLVGGCILAIRRKLC